MLTMNNERLTICKRSIFVSQDCSAWRVPTPGHPMGLYIVQIDFQANSIRSIKLQLAYETYEKLGASGIRTHVDNDPTINRSQLFNMNSALDRSAIAP